MAKIQVIIVRALARAGFKSVQKALFGQVGKTARAMRRAADARDLDTKSSKMC
jgi:hypothetical protein